MTEVQLRLGNNGIYKFPWKSRWLSTGTSDHQVALQRASDYRIKQLARSAENESESTADLATALIQSGDVETYCSLASEILSRGLPLTAAQIAFLHHPLWIVFVYSGKAGTDLRARFPVLFSELRN